MPKSKTKTFITIPQQKIKNTNQHCKNKLKFSNKIKDINVKKQTFYFFNDILKTENFNPNNIKIHVKIFLFTYWICGSQIIRKNL